MPGVIGLIGNCANRQNAGLATDAITHFDHYRSGITSPIQGVEIAQVWRNQGEIAGSWQKSTVFGVSVFINGTVIQPDGGPRKMNADDVLAAYLSDIFTPRDYDGSFTIVYHRCSSLPIDYLER